MSIYLWPKPTSTDKNILQLWLTGKECRWYQGLNIKWQLCLVCVLALFDTFWKFNQKKYSFFLNGISNRANFCSCIWHLCICVQVISGGRTSSDSFASYRTPLHADFLLAHSTVAGYYRWRKTFKELTWISDAQLEEHCQWVLVHTGEKNQGQFWGLFQFMGLCHVHSSGLKNILANI